MIKVFWTKYSTKFSKKSWDIYIKRLPVFIQEKIFSYRRWQDKQLQLFEKLMILECLGKYGYTSNCLNWISQNEFGKPFINNEIDFNISHSGECVVCAVTTAGKVGIDIEKVEKIDIGVFRTYLTREEYISVINSSDLNKAFIDLWTQKECVLKCDGRGLFIPLFDVKISDNFAMLYDTKMSLIKVSIHPNYSCHLATTANDPCPSIEEIIFL